MIENNVDFEHDGLFFSAVELGRYMKVDTVMLIPKYLVVFKLMLFNLQFSGATDLLDIQWSAY